LPDCCSALLPTSAVYLPSCGAIVLCCPFCASVLCRLVSVLHPSVRRQAFSSRLVSSLHRIASPVLRLVLPLVCRCACACSASQCFARSLARCNPVSATCSAICSLFGITRGDFGLCPSVGLSVLPFSKSFARVVCHLHSTPPVPSLCVAPSVACSLAAKPIRNRLRAQPPSACNQQSASK